MTEDRRDSSTLSGASSVGLYGHQRRDRRKERLNTELLAAVAALNSNRIQELLECGASPEARCRESLLSTCHMAALAGSPTILTLLLSAGAGPDLKDGLGRQPHHLAAALGHRACLRVLIEAASSHLIDSPVLPQSESLLDRDNTDSWNHQHNQFQERVPQDITIGSTALHLASKRGDWTSVEFLLQKGANVEVRDVKGLSPLDVVGLKWETVDVRNELSIDENDSSIISREDTGKHVCKTVQILLNNGAKIPKTNIILKEGSVVNQCKLSVTALHTSVRLKDVETTEYLLKAGASLKTWNEEGLTAVHVAVLEQSEVFLRTFLVSPSSEPREVVELRDMRGRTPLHLAVGEGWSDGVELLLLTGANLTTSTNDNQTVLHLAAQNGHFSILKELLSLPDSELILESRNSFHETALWRAVVCKQFECVKILCERKVDVAVTLPGDLTLLHVATRNNTPEILQFLLQRINRDKVNVWGKGLAPPLHLAAGENCTECLQELLSAGADPYITVYGDTALHIAARAGHLSIVRVLSQHDPGLLHVRNSEGLTPLHVAAEKGHPDTTREMILHGADLGAFVDEGIGQRTAFDIILFSIPNSADFLKDIFDLYIETNDFPISDRNCVINVKYDLLFPHGRGQKQLEVIGALLNCGQKTVQEKLFLHSVIESFLYLKWKKLKGFFIFIVLLYTTLTLSLSTIAHISLIEKNFSPFYMIAGTIAHFFLFGSLIPIVIVEILNASQLHRFYLFDYESWVKWLMIGSTTAVGVANPSASWLRYVGSVAVLLAWIELLFLLSRCPIWGYYVHMFSTVALNVFKVLATFACLVIGFSLAFLIHFQGTEPFRNILEALVKVLVMTTEFDYEDMFNEAKELTPFSVVGRILFALFVVLVSMVMMNLITSLSVSDVARLKAQGRTQRLAKQAAFLSLLEHCLFPSPHAWWLSKRWRRKLLAWLSVPDSLSLHPSRTLADIPHHIKFNLIDNLNNRRRPSTDLSTSLHVLQDTLNSIIINHSNPNQNILSTDKKSFRNTLEMVLKELRLLRGPTPHTMM